MSTYVVGVELDRKFPDPDECDAIMEELSAFDANVGVLPGTGPIVTLFVPADLPGEAVASALAMVGGYGQVVGVTALELSRWEARLDLEVVPESA